MPTFDNDEMPSASLIKQFAAMLYDSLLIIALLFIAASVVVLFNRGEAIESNFAFNLYLLSVVFIFYTWFWSKSGQTLGMKVWKIRIVSELGGNPTITTGFLRLFCALISFACFGMGYFWRLFRPYTWHDKLSLTRIVDVPTPKKQASEARQPDIDN